MNHDNLAILESIVQNDSVTANVSEEGGQIVVDDPINSKENLDLVVLTQPEPLSQTGKVVQKFWQLGGKVAGISSNVAKSATEFGQGAAKSATELGQGAVKSATGLGQEAAKSALSQKPVREALLFLGNNTQASQAAKEASVEAHVKQVNLANVKQSIESLKTFKQETQTRYKKHLW